MNRLLVWLATGFGLGLSPFASGTVGSIPGLALAALISPLAWGWQAAVCAVLTILAVPICGAGEDRYGRKDDGRIVADEYMTFPICLIGLPWVLNIWLLPVAFVVNRVMDIIKPPPARQSQALRGGLGIVMDDFLSSLYALGLNHGIWYCAHRWLGA
ncbi:MAG: phosphatidylglycerophosphatase A [Verrucomicrobia bacterium]|nr:phosphatidylglycerophosphatase A [Verrucomicrobiota bacterium]